MWTPKIKEMTCSNKIEFIALKDKVAYLEIRICEVNAHLGEYLVEIFVGNCPHMGYHPYTLVILP